MGWSIEFDPEAFKDLARLDEEIQRRILKYLRERIAPEGDPQRFGKPLRGAKFGLWRYRIGDYRIVCTIEEPEHRIRILRVRHRRHVYDDRS